MRVPHQSNNEKNHYQKFGYSKIANWSITMLFLLFTKCESAYSQPGHAHILGGTLMTHAILVIIIMQFYILNTDNSDNIYIAGKQQIKHHIKLI